MQLAELGCSVAGNEARAILYTVLPPNTVLAFNHFNQRMDDVQKGEPLYVPAPRTYFKYTGGFVKSGLGETANQGRIKNGFVSYRDERALALGGDLLAFSAERSHIGLSDLFEANRTKYFPRAEAIRILLGEPDGLSFAELTERAYGDAGRRHRDSEDMFVRQLAKRGLIEIVRVKSGIMRGPKTRVQLADNAVEDCEQFQMILDKHTDPTPEVIAAGRAQADTIIDNTALVPGM